MLLGELHGMFRASPAGGRLQPSCKSCEPGSAWGGAAGEETLKPVLDWF